MLSSLDTLGHYPALRRAQLAPGSLVYRGCDSHLDARSRRHHQPFFSVVNGVLLHPGCRIHSRTSCTPYRRRAPALGIDLLPGVRDYCARRPYVFSAWRANHDQDFNACQRRVARCFVSARVVSRRPAVGNCRRAPVPRRRFSAAPQDDDPVANAVPLSDHLWARIHDADPVDCRPRPFSLGGGDLRARHYACRISISRRRPRGAEYGPPPPRTPGFVKNPARLQRLSVIARPRSRSSLLRARPGRHGRDWRDC